MRYIRKKASPDAFERWKAQEQPSRWTALLSKLPAEPEEGIYYYSRTELVGELVDEQQGICAYCNQRIDKSNRTPIDHVEPRDGDTQTERIFDYGNLVASCDGNQRDKTKPTQRHCDNHKGQDTLPITPLTSDCQQHMRFADTGKVIQPSDRDDIKETIRVLNLNVPKLVIAREAAIAGEIFTDVALTELLDPVDARTRLDELLAIEFTDVELPPYFGAIVSVLERLATSLP